MTSLCVNPLRRRLPLYEQDTDVSCMSPADAEFAEFCLHEIEREHMGFRYADHLVIYGGTGGQAMWTLSKKTSSGFTQLPLALTCYKRCMEVIVKYLMKRTSIPNQVQDLLEDKMWPTHLHHGRAMKKSKMHPTTLSKEDRIKAFFNEGLDAVVEKLVGDIKKHVVLAWGLTECLLYNTMNPFAHTPLLPYATSPMEWLENAIRHSCTSMESLVCTLTNAESEILSHVLYRNKEECYVVAKSNANAPPTVHLAGGISHRPDVQCPNPFVLALFFFVYAGGEASSIQLTNTDHLRLFLSDTVFEALRTDFSDTNATKQFKRTLIELTNGRTSMEILDCFNDMSDMMTGLVVCPQSLSYDMPVAYVHVPTAKMIKLAVKTTPKQDRTSNVMARWTNLAVNPPKMSYVESKAIRSALLLDDNNVHCDALEALASESELSLARCLLLFTDAQDVDEMELHLEKNGRQEYLAGCVHDGLLHLPSFSEHIKRVRMNTMFKEFTYVGKGPLPSGNNIVYCNGVFHVCTPHSNEEERAYIHELNKASNLRVVSESASPLVSDIIAVDEKLLKTLNAASTGQLARHEQQINAIRSDDSSSVFAFMRVLFIKGPWQSARLKVNFRETISDLSSDYGSSIDTLIGKGTAVPNEALYLIRTVGRVNAIIYRSSDSRYSVYRFNSLENYNRLEVNEQLSCILNTLDVPKLFDSTVSMELASDTDVLVYFMHLLYVKRQTHSAFYDRVLDLVKGSLTKMCRYVYGITCTTDMKLAIFCGQGNSLVTSMIETEFFKHASTKSTRKELNIIDHISRGLQKISCKDCCLISSAGRTDNILLGFFWSEEPECALAEATFRLWLASDAGEVGFFILPCETLPGTPMDSSQPTLPKHCLTLVATQAIVHWKPPTPLSFSHTWRDDSARSHLHTLLLTWLTYRKNELLTNQRDV